MSRSRETPEDVTPPRRSTLGMMAKYWSSGQVKTRLGQSIGMRRAAALHQAFVTHLCRTLSAGGSRGSEPTRRVLCIAPDERLPCVRTHLEGNGCGDDWQLVPQGEGGLGCRMERWFSRFLTTPGSRAVLIGADCPTIDPETIREAMRFLSEHDLVLGPAADGGYYLIGLRGGDGWRRLFRDIPWSTEHVMDRTRQRARELGLSIYELDWREDIDTVADLDRLRRSLDLQPDVAPTLRAEIERIMQDPTPADG